MNLPVHKQPLAAEAHALSKLAQWDEARAKLMLLISQITGVEVKQLTINRDQYSLNSLNGIVSLIDSSDYFFKYHHEEGEEHSIEEYYRAELLKQHGFPVDVPVFACKEPGRQILLYTKRDEQRLADVCRTIEMQKDWANMAPVIEAQVAFDKLVLGKTLNSYRVGTKTQVNSEAIHQLFYRRLVDKVNPVGFGGRVAKFYVGKTFALGSVVLDWDTFANAKWQINGIDYPHTIFELFQQASNVLDPINLANHGVVTAHGDAHNANVWFEQSDKPSLSMFDPAFAGEYIPALLSEIKATFHNIFAHPYWLYEPKEVESNYDINVYFNDETSTIHINHNWDLTPLRQSFLDSKMTHYWKPLIQFLADKNALPAHWKEIIRLGLFCCPTLVMNLRASADNSNTAYSSALGFALAVSLASSNDAGLSHWVDSLETP
ncbi:hypothetical protein [Vibrio sp. MA40-2]|uniref:hypothetical protein n=1 Tax=Vibrio sp. MA40-2 TaxID=3391828 RepID=UPI0039A71FBB